MLDFSLFEHLMKRWSTSGLSAILRLLSSVTHILSFPLSPNLSIFIALKNISVTCALVIVDTDVELYFPGNPSSGFEISAAVSKHIKLMHTIVSTV